MPETSYIYQLNISNGGVPKTPIECAEVDQFGILGDKHRDTEHHGGSERALCLFSWELIQALQAEGHPITPGAVGENITTAGIDFETLSEGARLRLGPDVVIEITRHTIPCTNIRSAFNDERFVRISHKVNPGWSRYYARVLQGGTIRTGDEIKAGA